MRSTKAEPCPFGATRTRSATMVERGEAAINAALNSYGVRAGYSSTDPRRGELARTGYAADSAARLPADADQGGGQQTTRRSTAAPRVTGETVRTVSTFGYYVHQVECQESPESSGAQTPQEAGGLPRRVRRRPNLGTPTDLAWRVSHLAVAVDRSRVVDGADAAPKPTSASATTPGPSAPQHSLVNHNQQISHKYSYLGCRRHQCLRGWHGLPHRSGR